MDCEIVLLYGVEDVDSLSAFRLDISGITDLSSHLRIERSAVEHELEHCLVLLLYGALLDEADTVNVSVVVAEEFLFLAIVVLDPVAEFVGSGLSCPFLLLLELGIELFQIDCIAFF